MRKIAKKVLPMFLAFLMAFGTIGTTFAAETTAEETEETVTATEINSETVWSYWDEETDPAGDSTASDYVRTSWTLASYDVSEWKTGVGSFGAKNGTGTDVSGYTVDNLLTQYYDGTETDIEAYFFRTSVYVEDASAVTSILGEVIYDDSATIYINGVRVAGFDDDSITANMEYGGSNAGTPKTGEISVTDAETIASALVDGENIIAVEVHNGRSSSSDIYFEMTSLTFDTSVTSTETTVSVSLVDSTGAAHALSSYLNSTATVTESSDGTVTITFSAVSEAAEYITSVVYGGEEITANEDGSYTITVSSAAEGSMYELTVTAMGTTMSAYLLIGSADTDADDSDDSDDDGTEDEDAPQSSIALSVGADETERYITWYTQASGIGIVYYMKASELSGDKLYKEDADYAVAEVAASTNKSGYYYFQAVMDGLEAGETYAYQIMTAEGDSEVFTFTISEDDGSFSFALVGDPQIGAGSTDSDIEGWEATLDTISTDSTFEGIDFLLSVGDQVNTASSETEYDGYLENDVISELTMATVIGNHDSSSAAYSEHFNIVNESSYGTTNAGGDYYYVYEGVLFLVLNSNNTSTAEHKAFMEEAIAEAEANYEISWKVVTFHHSIYSVASHSTEDSIIQRREQLVPVFEELDIDVVLMGHDHVYARTYMMDGLEVSDDEDYEYDEDGTPISVTNTNGILYVTVNSASGSKYYSIKTNVNFEYAAVMNQDQQRNASRVDVTEDSFTVTTYNVETMEVVDTFTIYRECEHNYEASEADEDGVITYTCTECGDTYTVDPTEITILYTNDVHTYIDESITYSSIAAYKDTLDNVLLVDAGDHIQGTAYGSLDEGETIIELMNETGYDLATLGNHEFDYDMDRLLEVIEEADYEYISSNFYQINEDGSESTVLDGYTLFEVDGITVAFVGITTPESITKSTPAYFQDDDGNYIYGIYGGEDGTALYEAVQESIDAAEAAGADIIIALGHLGVDESSEPWTSYDLIANVTGLDAFIDGHSHTTMEAEYVEDAEGNEVLLTQTGCYLETLGQMTITVAADGTFSITTDLLTSDEVNAAITDEDGNVAVDETVAAMEEAWITSVDEQLGEVIAETEITFTIYDEETGDRIVREAETNLGDLDADAYYYYINEVASIDCDIAISNGGGVRAEIAAGEWTYLDAKTVNPFGNVLCVVEVTGQDILDALEFGARYTTADASGAECGGFLQVAGLTYKVDTSIENTIIEDEYNIWISGPTEYRVYDVQVYNKETGEYEDLDLDATYTLGGTNYTLRDCGDGFDMFSDSYLVLDGICEDYLALSAYLMAFTDTDGNGIANVSSETSPLASYTGYLLNYEDASGAGRITIADGKEVEKTITEIYGDTRYETAEAAAQEAASESSYAVVASGEDYPDALTAASLAGALDASILLTSDKEAADTVEELIELGVTNVYIVGGTSSVSEDVQAAIEGAGITVSRVAGQTRQETALAIAEEVYALNGGSVSDICFVATGSSFADALAASAYSYWAQAPIYLTENDGTISDEVLDSIKAGGYSKVIILGGEASVSSETAGVILSVTGVSVTRLGGADRYETAALVAEWSAEQGMSYNNAVIATGTNFPDALAASALCGQNGSVILLANTTTANNTALESVLAENADDITNIYIIGGTNSVSEEVREMIKTLIG